MRNSNMFRPLEWQFAVCGWLCLSVLHAAVRAHVKGAVLQSTAAGAAAAAAYQDWLRHRLQYSSMHRFQDEGTSSLQSAWRQITAYCATAAVGHSSRAKMHDGAHTGIIYHNMLGLLWGFVSQGLD
jgi:hypothetical protein